MRGIASWREPLGTHDPPLASQPFGHDPPILGTGRGSAAWAAEASKSNAMIVFVLGHPRLAAAVGPAVGRRARASSCQSTRIRARRTNTDR